MFDFLNNMWKSPVFCGPSKIGAKNFSNKKKGRFLVGNFLKPNRGFNGSLLTLTRFGFFHSSIMSTFGTSTVRLRDPNENWKKKNGVTSFSGTPGKDRKDPLKF